MADGKYSGRKKVCIAVAAAVILILCFWLSPYVPVHFYGSDIRLVNRNAEYLTDGEDIPVYLRFSFRKFRNLKELNISCNEHTNLGQLKNMQSIEKLTLTLGDFKSNGDNTFLDKMPYMENVTELTIAGFRGQLITASSEWVSSFPKLEKLYIISYGLLDIDGLGGFERLKSLTISDINAGSCGTFSLNVLNNTNLEELDIRASSGNVPDTKGLPELGSVVSLSVYSDDPQYDLENISKMKSLKSLRINYCGEDKPVVRLDQRMTQFLDGLDSFEYFNFDIEDAE